jgi:hypothetical protein
LARTKKIPATEDRQARSDSATEPAQSAPPSDLSANLSQFWSAAAPLDDLAPPAAADTASALKRLGPLPFPKSGFPLMGFLTTVYEHVAAHVGAAPARCSPPDRQPERDIEQDEEREGL